MRQTWRVRAPLEHATCLSRLPLLACVLLVLACIADDAQGQASPWLDWRTLSSEHFNIHFPAEIEDEARHALAIAERVHNRLSPRIGWEPDSRTEIVLTDQVDFANGFATPLPYNHIYLYLTPPDGISSLADHEDWLELLITHEYTHTLHLDRASGFPHGARWVLGRNLLLFPNLYQPTWMIEGLAVHEETDDARGIGRGQSTFLDMQMRMEVASGIKPFDQVSMSGITEWPAGNVPYLYGAHFYRFVEERHGREAVEALVANYSNNVIPFLFNRNLRQTLGTDGADLWAEFEDYLDDEFGRQLRRIRARGLATGRQLTEHGYYTASAEALSDREVYYVRDDGAQPPALMRWTPDGEPREIAELNATARIDAHPQRGILVAQPEVCRNRFIHHDLYVVNPDSGRQQRLTHCRRYRDAAWLPDGEGILATRIAPDGTRIDRLDPNGRQTGTIWRATNGEVPGRIDVSPDGGRLAVSMWRPGRGWALELIDLDSGDRRALTDDATIEGDPAFTPDGRSLLFTSEHGGVYNLRRMNLDSGKTVTMTNVQGGAFSPSQGNDSLFYIGYTANGHDLFRVTTPQPLEPMPRDVNKTTVTEIDRSTDRDSASADGETRSYWPWRTLLPRSWFPVLGITEATVEAGFSTNSFDVLRNHAWSLTLAREFREGLDWGSVSYSFADRLHLFAGRAYEYDTRDVEGEDFDREITRARANDVAQARLDLPWIRLDWTAALHIGAGITRERDRFVAEGVQKKPEETSGVTGLAFTFDNTDRYPRSISRSHGREIRLIGESNEAFDSDFTGRVYTLDWKELIPLGGEHVLALRAVQGWGTEQPREFRLGGATATDLSGPGPMFDRRRYALRGYPNNFRGRRMRLATAEWRFPLFRLERGFIRFPAGLHQLSGRVFTETGATWDEGDDPDRMFDSAGLEVVTDGNLFYRFNPRIRIGVAKGMDRGGEYQGYLLLENAF